MQMYFFITNSAIAIWKLIQQQLYRILSTLRPRQLILIYDTIEKLVFDLFAYLEIIIDRVIY